MHCNNILTASRDLNPLKGIDIVFR